tara:strand:- start:23751 stop:24581 length:831 start_codon:yes stop_codon:yes gene_type:complete
MGINLLFMININEIFNDLDYEAYKIEAKFENLISEKDVLKNTEDNSVFEKVDPNNQIAYPPEIDDLIRLHFLIRKFKCIKVMEFGIGYSTKIIADALRRNEIDYADKLKEIRTDGIFKVFSIDSSKKWIKKSKELIPNDLYKYIEISFSKVMTVLVNNKITTQYKALPNERPDFIYIDGPSQWDGVEGSFNEMNTKHPDRMPISSDVILFEYFMTPGTIIYIDGRTNNARFLKNNMQRNWLYKHFINEDVHIFFLDEKPLGKYNNKHLEFIFSKED